MLSENNFEKFSKYKKVVIFTTLTNFFMLWNKEYYLEPSLFNIFKNIDYKGHFLKNDFGSKFSNLGMCGNSNDRKLLPIKKTIKLWRWDRIKETFNLGYANSSHNLSRSSLIQVLTSTMGSYFFWIFCSFVSIRYRTCTIIPRTLQNAL